MNEQETTYTVYCVSEEGDVKTISHLKSREEANRIVHLEGDTGKWRLLFSLDHEGENPHTSDKVSYYSPADEITRLQARIKRLETARRFYGDPNNYMVSDDLRHTIVELDHGDIARRAMGSESGE